MRDLETTFRLPSLRRSRHVFSSEGCIYVGLRTGFWQHMHPLFVLMTVDVLGRLLVEPETVPNVPPSGRIFMEF